MCKQHGVTQLTINVESCSSFAKVATLGLVRDARRWLWEARHRWENEKTMPRALDAWERCLSRWSWQYLYLWQLFQSVWFNINIIKQTFIYDHFPRITEETKWTKRLFILRRTTSRNEVVKPSYLWPTRSCPSSWKLYYHLPPQEGSLYKTLFCSPHGTSLEFRDVKYWIFATDI